MERFLLRAKVEEYEYLEGKYIPRWAEGYLNLVGFTETGPKFTFAELAKGECLSHVHNKNGEERYIYEAVEHSVFIKKTISRWTGKYDKNGKKIFEGDIVRVWHEDELQVEGVVVYGHGSFEVQDPPGKDGMCMCLAYCDGLTFTVVGNIHDNPELLGKVI